MTSEGLEAMFQGEFAVNCAHVGWGTSDTIKCAFTWSEDHLCVGGNRDTIIKTLVLELASFQSQSRTC